MRSSRGGERPDPAGPGGDQGARRDDAQSGQAAENLSVEEALHDYVLTSCQSIFPDSRQLRADERSANRLATGLQDQLEESRRRLPGRRAGVGLASIWGTRNGV
jgi:hypothetical protein